MGLWGIQVGASLSCGNGAIASHRLDQGRGNVASRNGTWQCLHLGHHRDLCALFVVNIGGTICCNGTYFGDRSSGI